MKQRILLLSALLAVAWGEVENVSAQSTYTWNAEKWSAWCGTISDADGKITGTAFNWGCIQIRTTTQFKLPKRQTYLVIKGENLFDDSNNPNVFDINGTNPGLKGFTINDAKTLAYVDITSILPEATDFFGNVEISSFGITLDQDEDYSTTFPTVTSIEFVAADILDAATEFTPLNDTGNTCTCTRKADDGDFKKTLAFTSGKDGNDVGISFSLDQQLNNSDMFLVIESDNNELNTSGRVKLRKMTVGGTEYENNTGGCYVSAKEVSTEHYLYIHSFYKGSDTSGSLMTEWGKNKNMNLTEASLYINNKKGTPINIYRMGFYNLSEIMKMYNLSGERWWYVKSAENQLDVEIHSAAYTNWLKVNNAADDNNNTAAYGAQLIRSMGVLPGNFTGIELRRLKFVEGNQPLTYDIFADLPETITTIFLSSDEYWHFPTMKSCVKVAGYKYKQFKEGVAPGVAPAATADGESKSYTSLTRELKAGYNSIVLPFNKLQYGLLPTGVEVYTLSEYNSGTGAVKFAKKTEGDTSNNLPAIVYVPADGLYMFVGRDPVTDFSSGYYVATNGDAKLVGSYVNEVPTGDYASRNNYGIDKEGKLAKMGATTKTAYYRAFLSLPAGAEARAAVFDDEPTGIKNLTPPSSEGGDGAVYDLQGRRVAQPTKGLYIVNGKKVVIK